MSDAGFRSSASFGASSDAEYGAARLALERGFVSEEQLEGALRRHDEDPAAGLLELLPLSPDQRQALAGAPAGPPLPEDVLAAMRDPERRVGRYWLLARLGEGGTGAVHRAWDERLGRPVALKLPRYAESPALAARLRREAELAAGLDHAHIAKIYEVGEHHGAPFIAMQLVDGKTLGDASREAPLERRVRWVRDAARAVAFAHARGVIHRDLKPGNIMIGSGEHVLVVDFGLARRTADAGTTGGRLTDEAGTINYMAPEQATGEPSRSSDVYGLGATLYELVTGRPPFTGETRGAVLVQLLRDEPVWPSRLSPDTPRDLEAIILKCLEKEPWRRYSDVAALIEDLDAYHADEPLRHARRPTLPYVVWKRVRRAPLPFALAGIALAATIGGGVMVGLARHETVEAERRSREEGSRVFYQRGVQALADRDVLAAEVLFARSLELGDHQETRERLLEARARGARLLWTSPGRPGAARLELRPALDPDGRLVAVAAGATIRLLDAGTGKELRPLAGHEKMIGCIAFSPDGRRLASGADDGTVRVWSVETGQGVRTFGHAPGVECIAFSPDGERLASGGHDWKVRIWEVETGKELAVLPHATRPTAVAFSPDGGRLASGEATGTVRLWNARTGEAGATLGGHERGVGDLSFGPDGRRLAVGYWDGTASLRELETGKETLALAHEAEVIRVAVSPDGERLLSASRDGMTLLWDIATARGRGERRLLALRSEAHAGVACSPDARRIVVASPEGTVSLREVGRRAEVVALWAGSPATCAAFGAGGRSIVTGAVDGSVRIWDAGTGSARDLRGHAGLVNAVAVSRDGGRIASASVDGTVRVWDAETGKALRPPLAGHQGEAYGVAFGPGGRLASTGKDGTVRLWDVDSGRSEVLRGADPVESWAVAWSPDGRSLAWTSGTAVYVRSVDGGPQALRLEGSHSPVVLGIAFSPDGRALASCGEDRKVRLRDLATGQDLCRLGPDHEDKVNAVAFSPDGRWLASCGDRADRTVHLWDLARPGTRASVLRGHDAAVDGLAFSPDGKRLVSTARDRTLRIWDLEGVERVLGVAVPAELLRESERETGLRVEDAR